MVTVCMVTQNGEEHGMINQLPNSVPFNGFKDYEGEYKEKMKKELEHRKKVVKGRYINMRDKHDRLEKCFCAGPGEPIQIWKLIPEYTYDLPMGMIDEINASGLPVRSDLVSVDGTDINRDGSPTKKDSIERIHQIVPTGF